MRVQLQSLQISDFTPASSKEFLDIQATIECGFTREGVRDMARTYSQGVDPLKVRHTLDFIAADTKYLYLYSHIYV